MSSEAIRKKGGISVETEHIFPIIKKWLYSEKEIFLRELVSNAADAITKLRRLSSLGEVRNIDESAFQITVSLNKTARTITVTDNGIGMTEDELERYICNIALSGALEFIQKYEGESKDAAQSGIIGHFGLGFYSAFMVSEKVDVLTKSYTGAQPVKWRCRDTGEYEILDADPDTPRGTSVVLHLSDEGTEYLSEYRLREILTRYCAFMPVPIFLVDEEKAPGGKDEKEEEPAPINDTQPLWTKPAAECTDEAYKAFYRKVFNDYREPLFYIHINADYPLNFKGILYFPRINSEFENMQGQVKLYYNQVFVADNIKEVMPEYLLMLRGVLDCPELPLNVSRSYLQNNGYVAKISNHIGKKVADKLVSMLSQDRAAYEKLWADLKIFVEYACMSEKKFYERVRGAILFAEASGGYLTLDEYLDYAKDKHEKTVYYATDREAQAQYISLFTAQGLKVVLLDKLLDTQFISVLELHNEGVRFMRVDTDIAGALKGEGEAADSEALKNLFREVSQNDKLAVRTEPLKDESVPAVLNISEDSRRMEDMMRFYAPPGTAPSFPGEVTLIANTKNPLIRKLLSAGAEPGDTQKLIAGQIYRLALLSQRKLTAEELQAFLKESYTVLEKL